MNEGAQGDLYHQTCLHVAAANNMKVEEVKQLASPADPEKLKKAKRLGKFVGGTFVSMLFMYILYCNDQVLASGRTPQFI